MCNGIAAMEAQSEHLLATRLCGMDYGAGDDVDPKVGQKIKKFMNTFQNTNWPPNSGQLEQLANS